jgi:superfamily II DNA/RNA helicase
LKFGLSEKLDQRFAQGQSRLLFTTSGLSAGVNFPQVEGVIHAGAPYKYTLVEFVQESGRAGRAGQPSLSLVIPDRLRKLPDPNTLHMADLNAWIKDHTQCRRVRLSKFMDGRPVSCADLLDAQECDICQPGRAAGTSLTPSNKPTTTPPAPPPLSSKPRSSSSSYSSLTSLASSMSSYTSGISATTRDMADFKFKPNQDFSGSDSSTSFSRESSSAADQVNHTQAVVEHFRQWWPRSS